MDCLYNFVLLLRLYAFAFLLARHDYLPIREEDRTFHISYNTGLAEKVSNDAFYHVVS